jgi:ketosteroid isomerase-like protein
MSVTAEARGFVITADYIEEISAAFNRKDVDAITEYFAEDGIFQIALGTEPWGTRISGKEKIREFLAKRFEQMPDLRWEDSRSFVSANRGVSEWVVKGTTPEGKALNFNGCDLYTFNNEGKITFKDSFWKFDPES